LSPVLFTHSDPQVRTGSAGVTVPSPAGSQPALYVLDHHHHRSDDDLAAANAIGLGNSLNHARDSLPKLSGLHGAKLPAHRVSDIVGARPTGLSVATRHTPRRYECDRRSLGIGARG
jgi:hypothetical protein